MTGLAWAQAFPVSTSQDIDWEIDYSNQLGVPADVFLLNDISAILSMPARYDVTIDIGSYNFGLANFSGDGQLRLQAAASGFITLSGMNTMDGGLYVEGGVVDVLNARALGAGPGAQVNLVQTRMNILSSGSPVSTGDFDFQLGTNANLSYLNDTDAGGSVFNLISDGASLQFSSNASAADAVIINNGTYATGVYFYGQSTAGNSYISNTAGFVGFQGTSTAANARISNGAGALVYLRNDASLGNARVENAGTLSFLGNSTAGSATIANFAGGRIDFNSFSTGGQAVIDNRGGIVDVSTRSLPDISFGLLLGFGDVALGNKTLRVGSLGMNAAYSGEITGVGGQLVKEGLGMLTLSGDNTYSGVTTIEGGMLRITGSLASAVTVGNDTILQGGGRVGGATISAGGFLLASPTTGALEVDGNLTFESGSFLHYETDPFAPLPASFLVTGMASLDGTFDHRSNGYTYAEGDTFLVMEATGGVSGRFRDVITDLAFLDVELTYGATDVAMTIVQSGLDFENLEGLSTNQRAAAAAVDSLGRGSPLFDEVLSSTADQARLAFQTLNGEIHASAGSALSAAAMTSGEVIAGRLRQHTPSEAALGYAGNTLEASDRGAWMQAYGNAAHLAATANAVNVDSIVGGLLAGADTAVGNAFTVGVAAGINGGRITQGGGHGIIDHTGAQASVYGSWDDGVRAARFGASLGYTSLSSSRTAIVGGLTETLTASYGARTTQAFGEFGYRLALGQTVVEPYGGLAVVGTSVDGFTETGGVAALSVGAQTDIHAFSTIGLRGEWTVAAVEGAVTSVTAGLAWRHRFGGDDPGANVAFASGGQPFAVTGLGLPRDALLLEAGISHERTGGMTFSATYNGDLSAAGHSHAIRAGLSQRF